MLIRAFAAADVYLGAPCAVPVDPRHRLVVPKYNPARTVTPEGAIGIGGAYMCIYPMESPGGYQLVRHKLPSRLTSVVLWALTPDRAGMNERRASPEHACARTGCSWQL